MRESMNPNTSVLPVGRYICDSDEDLTDDQIVEALAQLTADALAGEPDY